MHIAFVDHWWWSPQNNHDSWKKYHGIWEKRPVRNYDKKGETEQIRVISHLPQPMMIVFICRQETIVASSIYLLPVTKKMIMSAILAADQM
jgi:hypothetical protein